MHIMRSRLLWLVGVAAGAYIAGCGGGLITYRGQEQGYATHPFVVRYPRGFEPMRIPQVSPESFVLISFTSPLTVPAGATVPRPPAMVTVGCYRFREGETAETFMERLYDEHAPRSLHLETEKIEAGPSGRTEYIVSDEQAYFVMRVIPLPDEDIAYVVETRAPPEDRDRYAKAFAQVRESFQLLPKGE